MNEIARRVIKVMPDQVIGPPRRKRQRHRRDPMEDAPWVFPGQILITPTWGVPEDAPTQQGFGHFDEIAQRLKK